MKEGMIALAALPQSDGKTKLRPVLLLKQFPGYGLKSASVVRLGFLASLPTVAITGIIGEFTAERRQRLLNRLVSFLRTE